MIIFEQDDQNSRVSGYTYHTPQSADPYVKENGFKTFSTNYRGKDVIMTLETATHCLMDDPDYPSPYYDVTSLKIGNETATVDDIQYSDHDLYIAIQETRVITQYPTDLEYYTFDCITLGDNSGQTVTLEYDQLDSDKYRVIACHPNNICL